MRRVRVMLPGLLLLSMGGLTALIGQQPYPPQGYPQPYPPQGYPQPYPPPGYPSGGYPPQGPPGQGYPQPGGQYPNGQSDVQDQPGAPVARLGVMEGQVSVRRGDSGDWVAAAMNAPLMAGDAISVGPGGRAELQLDYGDFVRIGGDTELRISDLEPGRSQIQLARGLITYRRLRDLNSQAEISTSSVAVHPGRQSAVRVEIAPDGVTKINVRRGDAEISTPRGSEHVREGGMMLVRGSPDDPEYQIYSASARDAWDAWNDQRDSYLERAQSNRYVSPDVYGAEDLDRYGRWGYDPAYGNVWTPAVPPGWAPYQNGQWCWEDYYGWTWVDYDPWGWAPFHYGSWYFRVGLGWTWFPGPRVGHYWYHPALVGFFGFGPAVGVGFGNIGWVPLAPFERFHPWYGPGWFGGRRLAVSSFNVVRNVNIAATYRNAGILGAARGVPAADFQRGVFNNQIAVNRAQLQTAALVRGAVPVTPTVNNLRFSNRAAPAGGPRSELSNQRFFSRMNPGPAAAARTPFAQQQAAMRSAMGGRGFVAERGGPAAGSQISGRPASDPGGWQRFGEPRNTGPGGAGANQFREGQSTAPGGGWDRFGSPRAPSEQRFAAPQAGPASPYGSGQRYGSYGERPVQMAPPIVRQREAAPGNYGSFNRGNGGGVPSYRAPSGGGGPRGGGGGNGGHSGGQSGGHR